MKVNQPPHHPGNFSRALDKRKVSYLTRVVVRFYEKEGRRFPWRSTNDPYVILVSELLLQKTTAVQVAKVLSEFLRRWPSIADLALADVRDIEEVIGGLGLRKRARFLKETAAKLLSNHGGKVPRGEALAGLKGVGAYTANAVRCFAFGERVPVVDSNVARVLRRYFGISGGKPAYADRELWELAGAILPARRYREFNYGLLDISAKYCRPKPFCTGCPLKPHCSCAAKAQREVIKSPPFLHREDDFSNPPRGGTQLR